MVSKIDAIKKECDLAGVPQICRLKENLQVLIGGKDTKGNKFPKAILTRDEEITFTDFAKNKDYIKQNGKWYKDVWYSNEWAERIKLNSGIDAETYLSTSIIGKRVFAPTQHFQMHFLPTYPKEYVVIDKNNSRDVTELYKSHKGVYKEIQFVEEKTIADLYINAWKYTYDRDEHCFVRLDDKKASFNSLHWYMLRDCIRYGGTAYDRIADLSRIIIYLLSKLEIFGEEKEIIDELVKDINKKQIIKLLKKELFLSNFIKNVKENPMDYIMNKRDIDIDASDTPAEWEK